MHDETPSSCKHLICEYSSWLFLCLLRQSSVWKITHWFGFVLILAQLFVCLFLVVFVRRQRRYKCSNLWTLWSIMCCFHDTWSESSLPSTTKEISSIKSLPSLLCWSHCWGVVSDLSYSSSCLVLHKRQQNRSLGRIKFSALLKVHPVVNNILNWFLAVRRLPRVLVSPLKKTLFTLQFCSWKWKRQNSSSFYSLYVTERLLHTQVESIFIIQFTTKVVWHSRRSRLILIFILSVVIHFTVL